MTEEATSEAPEAPPEPAQVTPQQAVLHNLQKLFQGYLKKAPNYEDRLEREFKDVIVAVWTGMGWKS